MSECVTMQRSNTSHEVINNNDGKPTNYLLPFLNKEIILGGTFEETKYEKLFIP
jgi:hypothetical protein